MSDWKCPTCSSTSLPPSWRKVETEWCELTDRERRVATHLLFGLQVYSSRDSDDLPERGWRGEVADAIRELLPTFWQAWDVADGVIRFLVPDEDDEKADPAGGQP